MFLLGNVTLKKEMEIYESSGGGNGGGTKRIQNGDDDVTVDICFGKTEMEKDKLTFPKWKNSFRKIHFLD